MAKHEAMAVDKVDPSHQAACAAATAAGEQPPHGPAMTAYVADPRHTDAPLSPEGEAQAARAAVALDELMGGRPPTLIVASPMTRALQTAAIVFAKPLAAGTARVRLPRSTPPQPPPARPVPLRSSLDSLDSVRWIRASGCD